MDDLDGRLRRMARTAPATHGLAADPAAVLARARRLRQRKLRATTGLAVLLVAAGLASPTLRDEPVRTSRVATNTIDGTAADGSSTAPPAPTTTAASVPPTSTTTPSSSTVPPPPPPPRPPQSSGSASAATTTAPTTSTSMVTTTTWKQPVIKRPAVGCETPRRPVPSGNGRILYTGQMGLSTMRPDGSDVRLFKHGEQLASWSPDGRRIAFNHSNPPTGRGTLVVADFETGEEVTIAGPGGYGFPKWSPDGSHLVAPAHGLVIIEDDGETQAYVENTDHSASAASLAPDCVRLVYEVSGAEGPDIYTINIDGTGRTRLSPEGPGEDSQPDWSPDGTQIAFARRLGDRDTQIFVMRADGTDVRQLTHEVGWHGQPSWSPDGTMIAYAGQAYVDGAWRGPIHVMRADGTDRRHIGPYDSPAWAPDWGTAPR